MEAKEALKKIAVVLGISKEINLEQMKLDDGVTIIEVDKLEKDGLVNIIADDQVIPLPEGEYGLEDGRILVVQTEGVIFDIMEAKKEEEQEVIEEEPKVEELEKEAPSPAKKVVESLVKETYFERHEVLKKENEELKLKISELEKKEEKEEVELEEVKPIVHNPENKQEVADFKYSQKRPMTAMDKFLNKLNK